VSTEARFLASHALLLLGGGIVVLALAVWVVVMLARAAARYTDLLWWAVDLVVPGRLRQPLTYLAVHLALGLVLVGALAAFAIVAENVLAGRELAAFDLEFVRALRAEASPGWQQVFWYLTWLGSGWVIGPVAVVVLWGLLARRHTLLAAMWAVSQVGSALLNYAMKATFARARPEGADPVLFGSGLSFPSGHAMNSLVLCGVGAYLIVRLAPSWGTRVPLLIVLIVFPLLMGFSRLYLGVHYASDVAAGYLAGSAWIAICVSGAEVALRRKASG
jgi:undecaprenyl-diphosphatase